MKNTAGRWLRRWGMDCDFCSFGVGAMSALRPLILVCGGRNFLDHWSVMSALDGVHKAERIGCIVQGGAEGTDRYAARWAEKNAVPCLTVPADWKAHGRAAGPIRNRAMLELKPDGYIASEGGRGTANMVGLLRGAGVPEVAVVECGCG